ncbi:hypothetical protein GCM10009678_32910 [Actinomadura kijaniata]
MAGSVHAPRPTGNGNDENGRPDTANGGRHRSRGCGTLPTVTPRQNNMPEVVAGMRIPRDAES